MHHVPSSGTAAAPLVQRVRHELKLRALAVSAVERLSPGFIAITLEGEALADFTSLSFDDHVKLMFDDEGAGEQVRRDYTPRRFSREARRLTIEFALHGDGSEDGKAAAWARQAQVGQRLLVGGPRGSMVLPLELGWHLLVGDASALPAIARRLEELPAGSRAWVVVQAEAADRRALPSQAEVALSWCDDAAGVLDALGRIALPSAATGFAWGGGEAALMAAVREILVAKGVPRQLMRVSSYWKRGVADHHETLE